MKLNKYLSYSLLFLLLPITLLLIFGRFGLEDSDSGFLAGMGWRILNGEIPYKDFYYVRPIASPLISAFWLYLLPDYGQDFMMRLVNYYQLIIQVFFTILILNKYYDFKKLELNIFLFSFISILITSIGTVYFQWHTTDGIFFAVLGFFVIAYLHDKYFLYMVGAGALFGVSALTKQNFLIAPILGVLFVFFQYGLRKSIHTALGIFIPFVLFFYYLKTNNIIDVFLLQNTGSTTIKDLLVSGVFSYFMGNNYLLIYSLLSLFFFNILNYFSKTGLWRSVFLSLVFSLVLINSIAFVFISSSPRLILFDKLLPIVLIYSFIYLFLTKREKIKDHYIIIALLGVSWASSISWGGMNPLMYFTPVIFSAYYLLKKYFDVFDRKTNTILIALIIIYSLASNTKLYRNDFIWNTNSDAIQISKKLAFIKTNDTVLKKHLELKEIFKKYDRTTILPSMPGAYYIHDKINYFSIDWAMDVEAAFDREGLIKKLDNCCNYYIVEKKSLGHPVGTEGKFYSSITDYVLSSYILYDSSFEFFDIYKNE